MSTPLLSTKLYIPVPRSQVVLRPHLLKRLDEGLSRKLTLISAPAGFGKTTLVSEWIAACARLTAWLSLDEADREATRFLAYLVAALRTIVGDFGDGVLRLLHSPQPPPLDAILTTLLNEIATIPDDFVLVLDDYHVIDAQPIDQALTFLLEHLPPQMHLVITTREDPPLPLARLRARGHLTEVRAADLRFTLSEAAGFLNQVMGLHLADAEVEALEIRTEGWIAGLQLAALSMRGRDDSARFIQAFAGDNRYIVDYLVEEVLQRQPEEVRRFLIQTSILDQLSGPLCDAVTEQSDSPALLDALERGNLFVVPLDDRRQWFRYHHLFADMLAAHARQEDPAQIPILHQRASAWYAAHGFSAKAIRHALAAADFTRVAGLVELAWPSMDASFESATWLGWVKALPDELIRARPVLSADCAWAFLNIGELEAAERRLQDAERWLTSAPDRGDGREEHTNAFADGQQGEQQLSTMVVVDEDQFRTLPASIASARAFMAQAQGDLLGSITYGQRALDLLPRKAHLKRGVAGALLGLAYWTRGELDVAQRTLADGMANMQLAGNLLFALRGTYSLADIKLAQGRLREAIRVYEEALRLAKEQGEDVLRGTADLYVRLSELYREQDNVAVATEHLQTSEALGVQDASPFWSYRLCLAQARIQMAHGDLAGALDLLDEAARLHVRSPVPDVRPIAALRTRVWVAQGRLDEALQWGHEQGLSVEDELSYLREFEHITLARVLLAQYQRDREDAAVLAAMQLLARLLDAAEAGARRGSMLEILMLQALALAAQGDIVPALVPLERALRLAAPEGYVRCFVDEGEPMARLLSVAAKHAILPDYTARLLAVFAAEEPPHAVATDLATSDLSSVVLPTPPPAQPLIEPLSERELEVLHLVAQGLSNREISERLFLALSSVKGHNRNIFAKLQVQRRTEAVARARSLGLLSPDI